MSGNLFGSGLFASIVAASIAAASAIVQGELDLARGSTRAAARSPVPASAPLASKRPPVTVVGQRTRPGSAAVVARSSAPAD